MTDPHTHVAPAHVEPVTGEVSMRFDTGFSLTLEVTADPLRVGEIVMA